VYNKGTIHDIGLRKKREKNTNERQLELCSSSQKTKNSSKANKNCTKKIPYDISLVAPTSKYVMIIISFYTSSWHWLDWSKYSRRVYIRPLDRFLDIIRLWKTTFNTSACCQVKKVFYFVIKNTFVDPSHCTMRTNLQFSTI